MRLLVSGATQTIRDELRKHPALAREHLGHLLTPDNRNKISTICSTGLPIAVDNSCYTRCQPGKIAQLWGSVYGVPILWATMPDVVADAQRTLDMFAEWLPVARVLNLPVALVAQDGLESLCVPWDEIRCLFVGGSTTWKESEHALSLADEARRRGKLVHVGRVNTQARETVCRKLRADSFDGSKYSMFPETYIHRCLLRISGSQELMEV